MRQLIIIISLFAFISCKDAKNQKNTTKPNSVEQVKESDEHHDAEEINIYKNTWTKHIKLDNGTKWQANTETNVGVKKMQTLLKTQTTTTIEDYHQLASQLELDKNYVVKNCTMEGPSHDNLHVWLLPLMAKITALSKVTTVEDAVKIKLSIEKNINAYADYFE